MKKYILKVVHTGIGEPMEQPLDWSESDFNDFENGNQELESDVRGMAHELSNLDFWVEEVES